MLWTSAALCIQTILDSPWETKTFQLLSDVLGIKTKMLKTTHKNLLGLAPISIFNVISKTYFLHSFVNSLEHLSVPWRVMFLLIARLLYMPLSMFWMHPLFSFLVKFSISLDVSSNGQHSRVNFLLNISENCVPFPKATFLFAWLCVGSGSFPDLLYDHEQVT